VNLVFGDFIFSAPRVLYAGLAILDLGTLRRYAIWTQAVFGARPEIAPLRTANLGQLTGAL
jgi:hypothetical protein